MNQNQSTLEGTISSKKGFFFNLWNLMGSQFQRLLTTVVADYTYQSKNKFTFGQKQKIFKYLRSKYMNTLSQMEERHRKKFTTYDPDFSVGVEFRNLQHMKNLLLTLKTNISAAEDSQEQLINSRKYLKAKFFNEIAYEFDKQRYCSMGWGLVLAALICSTIYKRGRITRQGALFLTFGHAFGQISYHYNHDQYFDSVYEIFQEDALEFSQKEAKQFLSQERKKVKGGNVLED